jgi:hypothetical protein
MIDQQHRGTEHFRNFRDALGDPLGFVVGLSGGRFVEQRKRWSCGDHAGDVKQAPRPGINFGDFLFGVAVRPPEASRR